jgi:hypothetical protein
MWWRGNMVRVDIICGYLVSLEQLGYLPKLKVFAMILVATSHYFTLGSDAGPKDTNSPFHTFGKFSTLA